MTIHSIAAPQLVHIKVENGIRMERILCFIPLLSACSSGSGN